MGKINIKNTSYLRADVQNDFNVIEEAPTGDCFYGSVSVGLFGVNSYQDYIRLLTVHHLVVNKPIIEPNFEQIFNTYNYEAVVKSAKLNRKWMKSKTGWAAEPHLYVASAVLGRPVVVLQCIPALYNKSPGLFSVYNFDPKSDTKHDPLYVLHRPSHFESMLSRNSKPTCIDLTKCPLAIKRVSGAYKLVDEKDAIPITEEEIEHLQAAGRDEYESILMEAKNTKPMDFQDSSVERFAAQPIPTTESLQKNFPAAPLDVTPVNIKQQHDSDVSMHTASGSDSKGSSSASVEFIDAEPVLAANNKDGSSKQTKINELFKSKTDSVNLNVNQLQSKIYRPRTKLSPC